MGIIHNAIHVTIKLLAVNEIALNNMYRQRIE
jgi:hypothetical protein